MSKVDENIYTCDPPEQVEECLRCGKKEYDNCAGYSGKYRQEKERRSEAAKRREAQAEREWEKIRRMLDSGVSALGISRLWGKGKAWLYFGKHGKRYRQYRAEKMKGEKGNGDIDREA